MSELAFNLSGERFELPAKAAGWRVRRLKPKGAPEVVYGRSGIPLILPIDADIDDLRHEARLEGRYRLDLVDDQGRTIEATSAGYVCVQPNEPADSLPLATRTQSENPVVEAMRMNTELARTIIDRFPTMMDSAAVLLRAADGAGLPAREPRAVIEAAGKDDDEEEDDGEPDEEEVEKAPPPAKLGMLETVLEKLVPIVLPAVMSAIASGKVKIPGGVGAFFDCRKATPPARGETAATGAHATSTPDGAPAPGPRDPAPAGTSATTNAIPGDRAAADAPADGGPMAADLTTIAPADMAHFTAILNALSMRERMHAQALAGELSPAELRAWITELKQVSVADAIARIRGLLGTDGRTDGGAS